MLLFFVDFHLNDSFILKNFNTQNNFFFPFYVKLVVFNSFMNICVYIYIYMYTRTYIHTYRAPTHTCIRVAKLSHIHICLDIYICESTCLIVLMYRYSWFITITVIIIVTVAEMTIIKHWLQKSSNCHLSFISFHII